MDVLSDGVESILLKAVAFVIVQVLVYFILSGSSSVFSKDKAIKRMGGSFRMPRSASVRRVVALLSGEPTEDEPSSPACSMPAIREDPAW